jgi:menaquinone-dependent protoporphyrinogen oxidase
MTILVAYASKHGATQGIAERIAETLRQAGNKTTLRSVEVVEQLESYEAFVIGSAIYYGAWLKEAATFVRHNRAALAMRPLWLFSSGPLGEAVQDGEPQPKEITEFRAALQPRDHRIFFGALDHATLSFAERMVTKAVRAPQGDFRNWNAIAAWAEGIGTALSHVVMEPIPAHAQRA